MASNSHLQNLLQEAIQWCSESGFPYEGHISWTDTQLQTLANYFSQVEVDSAFSSRMYTKLHLDEAWHAKDKFKPQICTRATQLVESFLHDLGEWFKVPNVQQLSHMDNTLNKNQLVAGFIGFLLQLLHPHRRFLRFYAFPDVESRVVKELRFLVTILGDSPFQSTDHEQVQSMLAGFEQVANEAGILVHSLVFIPDLAVKAMNEAICALLEHVEQLKTNIVEFLDLFQNIVDLVPTPNYDVESLFIVSSLQHDLKDLIQRGDNPLAEVKDQIVTLQKCLALCQSLLKVPQCIDMEDLNKEPMVQVIGVAYDAEYIINSFLVRDIPLWYLAIRLTHQISKIKLIECNLQKRKKDCDIEVAKVAGKLSTKLSLHTNNDFGVDDIVVGFEEMETVILEKLVRGPVHLQSILIFGMSGLGKTTMARKLYNHQNVKYQFDKKSWCTVSQVYEKKNLLIDILVNLQNEFDESMMLGMDEGSLAQKIYQSLKGMRYLIVVDDIWNSYVWEDLQRIFPDDSTESRILFTSRNKHLAPSGCFIHELPFLSDDQCWELLEKKVFHNKPCPPYLQGIGKKIATKCYGLPLVVVVIAGILSTMDMEESAWKIVVRNLNSYMNLDRNKSVMKTLELSYKHLPPHLKPCFLILGVMPQASRIRCRLMKQWWVAEGFICMEEEKGAESMAERYLMELIDKSLVIVFERGSTGRVKWCGIHDLLHDLCLILAEKHHFFRALVGDYSIWHQKNHRLRILSTDQSPASQVLVVSPCSRFFLHASSNSSVSVLNMKSLRYLFCSTQLSNRDILGIELLVHLRSLVVNYMVPLIDWLMNLEFLIIVDGEAYITSKILQLEKLRFLKAKQLYFDKNCRLPLSQSNNLEYLAILQIRRQEDVEMLKYSPHLHTLKCIYVLPITEILPMVESICLDFNFLTQLESLTLGTVHMRQEVIFPESIKKLKLSGLHFSSKVMAVIGTLPNLEVLKLYVAVFEEGRWDAKDGEFKQLRFLLLNMAADLAQWKISSSEPFPKLQQLILIDCSKLIEIPSEIGEIATLELVEVRGNCLDSLVESAKQIQQQEEEDLGNQEFNAIIDNAKKKGTPWETAYSKKLREFLHRGHGPMKLLNRGERLRQILRRVPQRSGATGIPRKP